MTAVARPENRTTVRTSHSPTLALQAMRAGFRFLSPRAPQLAARWAEHLFLRPRRFARPAWESAALGSARLSKVPYDGGILPVWTWAPTPSGENDLLAERPVVLLVHGWEGRGSQLSTFVAPLLERGLRVVTFDAPGHGESTVGYGSVVEHARALVAVAREVGPVHAVIGHSVGGAAALFATRFGLTARRFALVAPPTSPSQFANTFAGILGLDAEVKQKMIGRLEARYSIPFNEIDARLDAKHLHVPLLVVHDEGDPVVGFDQGKELAELAPRGSIVRTQGLGHRAILRAPEIVETVTRFIDEEPESPSFAATLDGELFVRDTRW